MADSTEQKSMAIPLTALAAGAVVALLVGVLAVLQVITALWLYGKLGVRPPSGLGTVHRTTGGTRMVPAPWPVVSCSSCSSWRS